MEDWWTGYGRGWREPKATTPLARIAQIAREPATIKTYYLCGAIAVVGVWAIMAVL